MAAEGDKSAIQTATWARRGKARRRREKPWMSCFLRRALLRHRRRGHKGVADQRKRCLYKSSLRAATRRKKSRKNPLHDLPEEILNIIISRLTLKDAARMSTLSRMWKTLWNSHSNLIFDAAMVTHSHSKGDGLESKSSQEKKFIDIVNTVLRNHDGTHLDRFKVAFELREKHTCSLDSWIGFAVSSKASEIVLDLDPRSPRTAEDAYDFPFHLFQSENGIQSVWVKCVS